MAGNDTLTKSVAMPITFIAVLLSLHDFIPCAYAEPGPRRALPSGAARQSRRLSPVSGRPSAASRGSRPNEAEYKADTQYVGYKQYDYYTLGQGLYHMGWEGVPQGARRLPVPE